MKPTALQQNAVYQKKFAMLSFYRELGVFLLYPNIEGLQSVVIFEPQWLVDQFGKLLSSWKGKAEYKGMWDTLGQHGILVEPLYKAVLSSVKSTR